MRSPGALQLYACYPRFNVSKTFKITERHNVNLRAEFINLNTPILNAPSTGIGSQLGLLNSSQGARNVQFALK